MFCPECGSQVNDDAVFCPECGYNLTGDKPECGGTTSEPQQSYGQPNQQQSYQQQSNQQQSYQQQSYQQQSQQPYQASNVNAQGTGKKTAMIAGIAAGIVVLLGCAGFGVYQFSRNQARKEAAERIAKAEQEAKEAAAAAESASSEDAEMYTTNGSQGTSSTSQSSKSTQSSSTSQSSKANNGTSSNATAQTTSTSNDDYVLPNSSTTRLSSADIAGLSKEQVRIAINEIYARNGRKFDSEDLQNYFNSKSWYNGTIDPANFTDSMLSDVERANVDLLSERRAQLGG